MAMPALVVIRYIYELTRQAGGSMDALWGDAEQIPFVGPAGGTFVAGRFGACFILLKPRTSLLQQQATTGIRTRLTPRSR